MLGKSIHEILDVFTSKELERLSEVLKTGYLKQSESVQLLYNILYDIRNKPKIDYDKFEIYRILFSDDTFNDNRLRLVYSDLLKCIELYLSLEQTRKSARIQTKNLLDYYKKKNLTRLHESRLKKQNLSLKAHTLRNSEYQKDILEYELLKYDLLSTQKRNQELNLQDIHDRMDESYYAQKLRWACLALSHQAVYKKDYNLRHIDMILDQVDLLRGEKIPTIEIYVACYDMITKDTKDSFVKFKEQLDYYHHKFDESELTELYLLSINFCIRHLNKGEKEFGIIGIELYQKALNQKLLMIGNKLSRYTYRNIAMMAIRVENYEWAELFSKQYKSYIRKEQQESSYYFNIALIYYYRGRLDESLDAMIYVQFKDPLIHLAAKILQLKLYYELEEWQLLDSHLDTIQMYLIRKKILGYHKQNYKNIIKYTRHIIGLKSFDTVKREKLIKQIELVQPLTERKWLLQRIQN